MGLQIGLQMLLKLAQVHVVANLVIHVPSLALPRRVEQSATQATQSTSACNSTNRGVNDVPIIIILAIILTILLVIVIVIVIIVNNNLPFNTTPPPLTPRNNLPNIHSTFHPHIPPPNLPPPLLLLPRNRLPPIPFDHPLCTSTNNPRLSTNDFLQSINTHHRPARFYHCK